MNDSKKRERSPSDDDIPGYVVLLEKAFSSWKLVAVAALLLGTVLVMSLSVLGVQLPGWLLPGTVAVFATAPYAHFISDRARRYLWNPGYVYGVSLTAEDDEKGGIWRWPADAMKHNETEKGSLDWVNPSLFFARDISTPSDDADDRGSTLQGTWRGTLTDRQLMWSMQKVAECRGQLLDDAIRGFVIESSAWIVVYQATRAATDQMREMMEDGTLPDKGDGLDAAVTEAIAGTELDALLDEKRDLDLPDEWDADDEAFADPLGTYAYSSEVSKEAEKPRSNGHGDGATLGHTDLPGRPQEAVRND